MAGLVPAIHDLNSLDPRVSLRSPRGPPLVMAGLVPAIHDLNSLDPRVSLRSSGDFA